MNNLFRKIFLWLVGLILLVLSANSYGQNWIQNDQGNTITLINQKGGIGANLLMRIPHSYPVIPNLDSCGRIWLDTTSDKFYVHNCNGRQLIFTMADTALLRSILGNSSGNIDSFIYATRHYVDSLLDSSLAQSTIFPGGQVSSLPAIGQTINSTTIGGWLDSAFYASQPPTASLTGGTIIESAPVSTVINETLNWTAGRQSATKPLSTIVVAGNNKSFSQPSAPGTISGTQSVTITANTNQTFTGTVTTTDGKVATASTTYTFEAKRYWGYTNTTAPTDAQILAIAGGGNEFTTTRAKSSFNIIITGTNQNFYFAYPSSFGNLTSFVVGGFESLGVFTLTTRSLTNVNGFIQSYNIYVSNNTFSNTTISGLVTQ